MDMQTWNPYVRFARRKDTTLLQGLLQAVDHRILYFHSGSGYIEAAGTQYPIAPGSLIYMPAGTPYRYLFSREAPVFSGFNFDFFQTHANFSTPVPPVMHTAFSQDNILEKQFLAESTLFSACMFLENVYQFEEPFLEIADEFLNHNLYYDVRCSTLLKDILIRFLRLATTQTRGINQQKVDKILAYIHTNYQSPLTNKHLAEHFGYHENYIGTLILKYTGLTLHQYVLNYRMQIAVGLLQSTTLSVSQVAEKVGMPDIKHFSKCFKKLLGHAPSNFKVK